MSKKLLTSVVAASMLVLPALSGVHAEENYPTVGIEIDGVTKNFPQSAVLYNDITLIPLRGVLETLGVEVKWDEAQQKVTALKGTDVVELKIGSKQAFKNYKPITLSQEAIILNRSTMVPLRFVMESFGADVDWDEKTSTVKIMSSSNGSATTAGEATKSEDVVSSLPALTFNQAIEKAISNSTKLRAANVSIEQSEERRDKASDSLEYIPIGPGSGSDDQSIRNAFTNVQQADINLQKAKKEMEIAKESLTYQVKNAYNSVLQAEGKLQLAEKELELAKVQNNIKKQQAAVGLISEADKIMADNKFVQSEKEFKAAEDGLKKAYDHFNQLVGNSLDKRFNLVDLPKNEQLLADDVNYQVAKVLSDSTTIWIAEQNVRLAELGLELYVFNVPSNPDTYTSKGMEIDKAKYSVAQQKKDLEDGIRQTYHTIKDLENKYAVLETNLATIEQTQKSMKAKYDLGMIPLVNLLEANVAADQLKQQMFEMNAQLELLKMAYDKPWVASGM